MQLKVLVVDRDADVLGDVSMALDREGFAVQTATTRASAAAQGRAWTPDVAIVAGQLADGSGIDLLGDLRLLNRDMHVILTGSTDERECVQALVDGADDYVAQPCSAREVAARVMAVARRRRGRTAPVLDLGRLVIDRNGRKVTIDGVTVHLPTLEMDLLIHLATHPRQSFSREQLLRAVWRSSSAWQGDATVTEHIRRLREKIEVDPIHPRYLVTIRGVGYRFEPGFADRRASA